MPIYEYECNHCGHVQELITKSACNTRAYMMCEECGGACSKVPSAANFRVTGFNAKNGYNLPNYDDVIDSYGKAKKEWGKNK